MQFITWSYRYAEQILNSKLTTKKEIEEIIRSVKLEDAINAAPKTLGAEKVSKGLRPQLNILFDNEFRKRNWERQSKVFGDKEELESKIDFLKDRVGIEVAFTHRSYLGIDLLKFQTMSYSYLDSIDVGVYLVMTNVLMEKYPKALNGSLTFDRVKTYLPHFKSAIQVPIYVYGLE